MREPVVVEVPTFNDPRGSLSVIDFPLFKRAFWVRDAVGMRGQHSHLSCSQLIIPIIGTFLIILSKDGLDKREVLSSDHYPQGVLVPPGWCISYTPISEPPNVLLVLADESYFEDIIIPCEEEPDDIDH